MDKIEELLTRGVEEVIDKDHLAKLLKSKKKLRIKLGIDPTSIKIHIGHAVIFWKLRAFQELGHKVVFIVGDFTGQIGDTSDKDSERPMLTEAQIKKNMKTYFKQALTILDKTKTETHYNSTWLKKLNFNDVGRLASLFGVNEFTVRENMVRRLKVGKRVSVRELLYPLMQGYDSVAIKANVELGGTDQRFNLLAGRKIQKSFGQEPQDIMTMTLMEGTDGRKMSASWGNVINITDKPDDMFGKVMSIDDKLIKKYFVLATKTPLPEVEKIMKGLKNPRDQKIILAQTVTSQYYGVKLAGKAKENFQIKFGKNKTMDGIKADYVLSMPQITFTFNSFLEFLVKSGIVKSKSEARRKIEEKAVYIGDELFAGSNPERLYTISSGDLIRIGKRFLRIK